MRFWLGLLVVSSFASAQRSSGPAQGTLILDGGGTTELVLKRFVALAGGPESRIVVVPTGASAIQVGSEKAVLELYWPRERPEWAAYLADIKKLLGVSDVTILHTRDRSEAGSEDFVKPLQRATGVLLWAGNAGRLADAYLSTRTHRELEALLARGGVIYGTSAGAIIQGSFIVRGRSDKPLLMAPGRDRGFGFVKNAAINPHLTQAKRDNELINVVDAHPEILGIGIDEDAALLVKGNRFEVIGTGRAAIYDNVLHGGGWYYWLKSGDRFDLATWAVIR